jgi:hypothetical protein
VRLRVALISLACLALIAPAAASAGVRHQGAVKALRKAEAVRHGKGALRGTELTPLLKELSNRLGYLHGGERRRAERLMMRPTENPGPGEEAYAVPEAPTSPYCSPHFCVHWVAVNTPGHRDAPPLADSDVDGVPDYVETMSQVAEHVHQVENGDWRWQEPVGDGSRGGDLDKTDIYLMEIGNEGIFGYSIPDPNQKPTDHSQFAYLVMDNDFDQAEFPRYANPLLPMEVTAAHEYNHILQFGYDSLQDTWMFEATAVWAEDKVYDSVNDYVSYLKWWVEMTQVPLTTFDLLDFSDRVNLKVYGSAVWVRWLEKHFGQDVVRSAWEHSLDSNPPSFGPGAFNRALVARGSSFFRAFTRFAADTAEWRSSAGPFEEGHTWPDVQRAKKVLTPGTLLSGQLDHTAYVLHDVAPHGASRIRLVGKLPHGTAGAFALVGRTGPATSGALEVHLQRLPAGGRARVTVERPGRFARLTAVLINADVEQDGYHPELGDWDFRRADNQAVSALVTTDFAPPRVLHRSPRPDTRDVPRRTLVSLNFSEPVRGVSTRTLKLLSPDGHKVNARVRYDARARSARLEPKVRLRRHTGYVVKLTGGIVDHGGNGVPDAARTWTFRTGG